MSSVFLQTKPKAPPRPARPPQIQRTESSAGAHHDEAENLPVTSQQSAYTRSDSSGGVSSDRGQTSRGSITGETEVEKLRQEIRKKEREKEQQEEEFERQKKRLRQEKYDEMDHMDTVVKKKTREIVTLKEDVESKEKELKNLEKELKMEIKNLKKENKIQMDKNYDLERNNQKQKHEHAMTVEKLRFDNEKKAREEERRCARTLRVCGKFMN